MNLKDLIKNHEPENSWQIQKPYVIAEAGVNHEGSMDLAKRLIIEAKEGGADAIKFQTYKADKLASKNSPSYWDLSKEPTRSQFELFKKYDKFWKTEFEKLKLICDQEEIEFISTPFDTESASFLNDLMDVFKISSSDLNNLPFIEFICKFNKPILLSTGASYLWEVQRTVDLISGKNIKLCLMHCVLNYPTNNKDANLGIIKTLRHHFNNHLIGYSDHTIPKDMETMKVANLLGAVILEKHFTHDKSLQGNDHYHAMDKDDLKTFCKTIISSHDLIGTFDKVILDNELISRKYARRSLVAKSDIAKGEEIAAKHITWKRPATGINPAEYDNLIGKIAKKNIKEDDILVWNLFS